MFIRDTGLLFSFFTVSLSGFDIKIMLLSKNKLGRISSSSIFWNSLKKMLLVLYNFGIIQQYHLVLGFSLMGDFLFVCLLLIQSHYLLLVCLVFYFFLVQAWWVLCIQEFIRFLWVF